MGIKKIIFISFLVCSLTVGFSSLSASSTAGLEDFVRQPLFFVQNSGQVDEAVRFYEKGPGHATYFSENSVHLQVFNHPGKSKEPLRHKFSAVEFKVTGANHAARIAAGDEHKTKFNYFIGNDPAKWLKSVPTYKSIHYVSVYDKIDLKFYGNNRQLEYDVIVNPGGDPGQVAFQLEGAESLELNNEGELFIHLGQGLLKQKTPYVYQVFDGKQVQIPGAFRLTGKDSYAFTIGAYDTSRQLIIDPVIVYSDVFGGNGTDYSNAIAVDAAGSTYMTGYTESSSFPNALYPRDNTTYNYDAFVYKVNAAGFMEYVTVFGGTAIDYISGAIREAGNAIAVDSQGRAHIAGSTMSTDFPATTGAFQNLLGGTPNQYQPDAFYAVFDTSGLMVYASYLGGKNKDQGLSIAVDDQGDAYLAGNTAPYHYSIDSDFPVVNELQSYGGDPVYDTTYPSDGFITKFDFDPVTPANTTVVFSTYFGGNNFDYVSGIEVDSERNIYVTGGTRSPSFPGTSSSPIQSSLSGGYDAFISKINSAGNSIVYSTYLGGPVNDYGNAIDVDANGAAYIIGSINNPWANYNLYFPLPYAIQTTSEGENIAFVTKVNSAGTGIDYSTFLGGSASDQGRDIAVDSSGSAYVVGSTTSTDFPVVNPINGHDTMQGSGDGFLARLTPLGSGLTFSTFLGGNSGSDIYTEPGFDHILGVAVDNSGNAYLTGVTNSHCFPAPESGSGPACDIDYYGLMDAFAAKIYDDSPIPPVIISTSPEDGATDVSVDAVLSAIFSEEMNTGTFDGSFLLYASGNPISGTVGSTGNNIITFIPDLPLLPNTTYNATVLAGIQDTDGTNMLADYSWSFTTEPPPVDNTPPNITSHTPPEFYDDYILKPLNTVFTVTFSENVAPASLVDSFYAEIYNQDTWGYDRISGSVSYNQNTLTATFTPGSDLPYQESIYIRVTQDVTDLSGNQLYVEPPDWFPPDQTWTEPYEWEIQTICNPDSPQILSSDPVMWSTGAPIDTTISITFNKDMDPATMINDNFSFYVYPSHDRISGSVTGYDALTRTVAFAPDAPLSYNTTYYLVFNFIRDTDGIGYCLYNGNSVYFTTVSENQCSPDAAPPVITQPQDITVDCSGLGGTPVNLVPPAATDSCDPDPILTNDAPDLYPIGTTTVTWTATDTSGNSATAGQQVTVENFDNACSVDVESLYIYPPPDIDGNIKFGEWTAEVVNQIDLENGFIRVTNDHLRLYILIDMTADDGDDIDNPGDEFQVAFDVNNDGLITPGVDIHYTLLPDTATIRYQYYNGPDSWSGLEPETFSSVARGFGCFFGDGSQTMQLTGNPDDYRCSQHRVWEIAIDLQEIGAVMGDTVSMGVQASSVSPSFTERYPLNFTTNFSNLIKINTSYREPFGDDFVNYGSVSLEPDPIEFTQAIQDRQNSMPLVQDKDTVARVYVNDSHILVNTLCQVSLYAQKDGVDLPGSPITGLHAATRNIDRESLWRGPYPILLPKSWTQGDVTFYTVVRGMTQDDTGDRSDPITLTFTPKEIPLIWTIPLNDGTEASPNLENDDTISRMEDYTRTIFPVPDIEFVRKPWQSVRSVTDHNDARDALNDFFDHVLINWSLQYMAFGTEPFELPDQIFGVTPFDGGKSDPSFGSGPGRRMVASGGYNSIDRYRTMAHEINHNLGPGDCRSRDNDAMFDDLWGRHVSSEDRLSVQKDPSGQCVHGDAASYGCGAAGPDADWQELFDSEDIGEVGFDTRKPWLGASYLDYTIVSADTPELMSYCFRQVYNLLIDDFQVAPYSNTSWISPYRWERLFNYFETTGGFSIAGGSATLEDIEDVYYISGQVNVGGTGSLEPVISTLGIAQIPDIPGDHAIEFLDSDDNVIESHSFHLGFFDMETNQQQDEMSFNFQIPADQLQPVSRVNLMLGGQILDTIEVSDNAPVVGIISPNGGEVWSGTGTITWQGVDDDGDPLTYALSYSPDNGNLWIPVARDLTVESYTVDTSIIPGGQNALIRVIATDGFHTAMDDSDGPFTVDQNPPAVSITAPVNGDIFQIETKVVLKGTASDPEEGNLADSSLFWFLNDEAIANGKIAELLLPVGQHTITLRASDSAGAAGEDSVSIEIVPCLGGYDEDSDVDGRDIFFQATGQTNVTLADFASNFGKTSCD